MVFPEDGLRFVMVDPKKPYQRALWKRHFGFALDRFHIDHVLARQRAIEAGEQWVRLEEVPWKANITAGSNIEKTALQAQRAAREKTPHPNYKPLRVRTASVSDKKKFVGIHQPRGRPSQDLLKLLRRMGIL